VKVDVQESDYNLKLSINVGTKNFFPGTNKSIGDWRSTFYLFGNNPIGYMIIVGPSMQSNNNTFFTNHPAESYIKKGMVANIESGNLIEMSIYFTIRHTSETTWLNNKDIYLYPNEGWMSNFEFQNDCLTYTLFSNFNNIQSSFGTNHWIPFTEYEVDAREKFESNFMSKFIKGKIKPESKSVDVFSVLLEPKEHYEKPLQFSAEALSVFNAGRELWKYYHRQPNCNVNASLYDIREHFQGRNDKGKMNNKSTDEHYMALITDLRDKLKLLAKNIEPKVYEYRFLKA
jgi:hypothetical protein